MQEQKSAWFVGYLALMRIKKYMQKAYLSFSHGQV